MICCKPIYLFLLKCSLIQYRLKLNSSIQKATTNKQPTFCTLALIQYFPTHQLDAVFPLKNWICPDLELLTVITLTNFDVLGIFTGVFGGMLHVFEKLEEYTQVLDKLSAKSFETNPWSK